MWYSYKNDLPIDAFDLRQTFLLYARLDYDVIKELRHNDTRIKEKCFTLDTQKPKSIMRGEIQIMITDKVSCLDVKALYIITFKKNTPCTLAEWVVFLFIFIFLCFCVVFVFVLFFQISSLKFA